MIECKRVQKTYVAYERRGLFRRGQRREIAALQEVDLWVEGGEFVALLGRNGAGKTTLIKIVTTLLLPTAGAMTVAGFDVLRHPREVRRRIGLVLAGERTVYWKLTGRENLLLFAGLYDVPKGSAHTRAEELLALVGLAEFRDVPTEKYSTGMRKRLALAKALIHDPPLLILDEPTAGLDPQAVEALWRVLRDLRTVRKVTVLMATHNMLEAEALPDRLVILEGGKIVADGTPAQVKEQAGAVPTATLTLAGDGADPTLFGPAARVYPQEDGKFLVVVPSSYLAGAITRAQDSGLALAHVQVKDSTLWDAFLKLTGTPFDDTADGQKEGS